MAVGEGDRPEGEDYSSRLRKVITKLKRKFNLSSDFDWLLKNYILWGGELKRPVSAPWVERTQDEFGWPHVKIEITPFTTIRDVQKLWPKVRRILREAFPPQPLPRETLDEERL